MRALHHEFPDLTFDFTAKVEHILKHAGLMPELAELGCVFAVSAVESLSDTVLANLEKGHTRARRVPDAGDSPLSRHPAAAVAGFVHALDDARRLPRCAGLCGDKRGSSTRWTRCITRFACLVPPGSGLLSRPAIHRDLIGLDQATLTYRWTHPDPRLGPTVQGGLGLGRTDEPGRRGFGSDIRPGARSGVPHARASPASSRELPVASRPTATTGPRLTEPWFC